MSKSLSPSRPRASKPKRRKTHVAERHGAPPPAAPSWLKAPRHVLEETARQLDEYLSRCWTAAGLKEAGELEAFCAKHATAPAPTQLGPRRTMPVMIDGDHVADVVVRRDIAEAEAAEYVDAIRAVVARKAQSAEFQHVVGEISAEDPSALRDLHALVSEMLQWKSLKTELARGGLGRSRLALGLHLARAGTTGGAGVAPEEEDRLATWFGSILELAVDRSPTKDDDSEAASVLFWLIELDRVRCPDGNWVSRCPLQEEERLAPGEPGFLDAMRSIAPRYVRTVIAGASKSEIEELQALVDADDDELEAYRPLGNIYTDGEAAVQYTLDEMLQHLTLRRPTAAEVCDGFEFWAQGFEQISREHHIPGVNRIGAFVYLAKVVLADAAPAPVATDGGAS